LAIGGFDDQRAKVGARPHALEAMKIAGRIARSRQARDAARYGDDIARAPDALARELARGRLEPMIERVRGRMIAD